jgi:periplasmic protein TonB
MPRKVRATGAAFWRATAHHARSSWRFKPAMVDGRPVETHTVIIILSK